MVLSKMYGLYIKPEVDKIFSKLSKNDMILLEKIYKKIKSIQKNPYHKYKFLRKPLQNLNRVHIDKSYVLIFRIDHDEEIVELYYTKKFRQEFF